MLKNGIVLRKSICACLIDGEHYLPNLKESIEELSRKYRIEYVIFIGGTEKIGTFSEITTALPWPVFEAHRNNKPDYKKLSDILTSKPVEMILDLSDEPIVDYATRMDLASYILYHGIIYRGADFEMQPPKFESLFKKPSIAIWGTGKRIGKTAFGGFIARLLKKHHLKPGIVTLSRGGPNKPIVVRGDRIKIDLEYLLDIQKQGMHASSDCFEDALTARVPTFGCRRCGAGLSGKPFITVVKRGALMAEKAQYVKTVILEGSGASFPEIKTDKVILLMDVTQNTSILTGYLTPLRILFADFIILTMCEDFLVSQGKINTIIRRIRTINPKVKIATTVLRPYPLTSLKNKKIFLFTTASKKATLFLKKYIEQKYRCKICAISTNLSDKTLLSYELRGLKGVDAVVTELKAAAISVVALQASKLGIETLFLDNMPTVVDKGGNVKNLEKEILHLLRSR